VPDKSGKVIVLFAVKVEVGVKVILYDPFCKIIFPEPQIFP
jgi:hypothetical protein